MRNLEEIYIETEKTTTKLDEIKHTIKKLENLVSELKEKYPEISYEQLAQKNNIKEYVNKVIESKQKELELECKKSESVKLYDKIHNLENEKKQREESFGKQNLIEGINKILFTKGVLDENDVEILTCLMPYLQECSFLSEDEKREIKIKIDEKIKENNQLLNKLNVVIKTQKVNITEKFYMKNKVTSVVAKGKESVINLIRLNFGNFVDKVVRVDKTMYQKLCDLKSKDIKKYISYVFKLVEESEKNNDSNKDLIEFIDEQLSNLERQFENQTKLPKKSIDNGIIISKKGDNKQRSNIKINAMYQQMLESNNQIQKELQTVML